VNIRVEELEDVRERWVDILKAGAAIHEVLAEMFVPSSMGEGDPY
jgi:hypothetical protein